MKLILILFTILTLSSVKYTALDVVEEGLEVMDIQTKVLIRPMRQSIINQARMQNANLRAYVNKVKGGYIIEVNNLGYYEVLSVMSHEVMHIKQMESGQLVVLNEGHTVVYKGITYKDITTIPYRKRPWEIDAEQDSQILVRKLKERF